MIQDTRRWSLSSRIMRQLAVTAGILALALTLTGLWFVHSTADGQAEALLLEELDESRAEFLFRELTAESFAQVANELDARHPESDLFWRVWSPDGDELVGEFGDSSGMTPQSPWKLPLDQTVRLGTGYRWRAIRLQSGQTVALLLSEAPYQRLVDQYGIVAFAFMLVGFASVFLVGRTFSAQLSRNLSRIALRARAVQTASATMEIPSEELPEELDDVVAALEEMLINIRQETESSRVLIAGIAHELRAPIQNMIGETEVALMVDNSVEDYRSILSSQFEEMRHMSDAVNNLVALCSAPKAAEALVSEEFDFLEQLQLRLQREIHRAERDGTQLTIEDLGTHRLRGDREALLAAVRNFVSNAMDWCQTGGQVKLVIDGRADEIEVIVEDDGPGVPPELRAKIFEPFVRGPAALGRRAGYGLGLALAQSAALNQGGSLFVEDSPLGGARFRMQIPRTRRPGEAAPRAEA
jgi:signal transduction histidine kinase